MTTTARRPCLSLWERCSVRTLGGEGLSNPTTHNILRCYPLSRKSEIFASSPRGRAKVGAFCFGGEENARGRRGHAPALRTGALLLSKLLSRIEPGDLQWRGSTARVTGSHCQRPLAAPLRRKSEIFASSPRRRAKWGVFRSWVGFALVGRKTHMGGGGVPPPYERYVPYVQIIEL